jgi:hypothetical protein
MSSPVESSHAWEHEFQARFGTLPGATPNPGEREQLVQMCKDLLAQRERLRADLQRVQAERDQYLKSLAGYLAKECPRFDLDQEALFAQVVQEPTLRELIDDLERAEDRQDG